MTFGHFSFLRCRFTLLRKKKQTSMNLFVVCNRNLVIVCLLIFSLDVMAEEDQATYANPPTEKSSSPLAEEDIIPKPVQKEEDTFNAKDHTDWGGYYDPKNIFCGKYDCYSILGFDYEEFGTNRPDTKLITKRYRSLSREWHPDKSKHKDAKERFVKIARAYEVLTDHEQRKEYDFMRYNQDAYFQKYGANVLWHYAPKSDASIIIIILFIIMNWFTWVAQQSRWQKVADRFIKAAVEDWSPSMGGTDESKQLREEAMEMLSKLEKEQKTNGTTATTTPTKTTTTPSSKSKSGKQGKKNKVSGKEKKKLEQDALKPIVTELVNKMDDFGAGFHKPTWRDLFAVKLIQFPIYVGSGVYWQIKYLIRRLRNLEFNEEEIEVLTARAVGHVSWELASDEDRTEMMKRELWIMDNLIEWKEEQEVKNWSKADQKYYAKMKKKGMAKEHME